MAFKNKRPSLQMDLFTPPSLNPSPATTISSSSSSTPPATTPPPPKRNHNHNSNDNNQSTGREETLTDNSYRSPSLGLSIGADYVRIDGIERLGTRKNVPYHSSINEYNEYSNNDDDDDDDDIVYFGVFNSDSLEIVSTANNHNNNNNNNNSGSDSDMANTLTLKESLNLTMSGNFTNLHTNTNTNTSNSSKIDLHSKEFGVIGRGGCSIVRKAIYTGPVKTKSKSKKQYIFALKSSPIHIPPLTSQLTSEILLLSEYGSDCSNLINFYGAFFKEGYVHLVLEFMEIGDLNAFKDRVLDERYTQLKLMYNDPLSLSNHDKTLTELGLPLTLLSSIIHQCLLALSYLHYSKILHRDIKPGNILINQHGCVKVSDFGIAREMGVTGGGVVGRQARGENEDFDFDNNDFDDGSNSSNMDMSLKDRMNMSMSYTQSKTTQNSVNTYTQKPNDMASTFIGTTRFMSPERLQGREYSSCIDVWSLGLVVVEIMCDGCVFSLGSCGLPGSGSDSDSEHNNAHTNGGDDTTDETDNSTRARNTKYNSYNVGPIDLIMSIEDCRNAKDVFLTCYCDPSTHADRNDVTNERNKRVGENAWNVLMNEDASIGVDQRNRRGKIVEILDGCLKVDETRRMPADVLLGSPWFERFWDVREPLGSVEVIRREIQSWGSGSASKGGEYGDMEEDYEDYEDYEEKEEEKYESYDEHYDRGGEGEEWYKRGEEKGF